jgi:hypothetical protein
MSMSRISAVIIILIAAEFCGGCGQPGSPEMSRLGGVRPEGAQPSGRLKALLSEDHVKYDRLEILAFVLSPSSRLTAEEQMWLIGQLANEDEDTRECCAYILSTAPSETVAASMYLAAEAEEYEQASGGMVASLGRMGPFGQKYLLRMLKRHGPEPGIAAALAQTAGVKPAPKEDYPAPGGIPPCV